MELTRLTVTIGDLEHVASIVNASSSRMVLRCSDGDSVIAVAALKDQLNVALGVWLEVSSGYSASLCARDVATLSWLVSIEDVVVEGEHAFAHAEIVRALLSDDEVSIANEVATITKAYNRPAPPRPIRVWSYDGTNVVGEEETLSRVSEPNLGVGAAVIFA